MLELQHQMISEQFCDLLQQEQAVASRYESLAEEALDPAVKARLAEIYRDKQRHIALVQRLLEIMD